MLNKYFNLIIRLAGILSRIPFNLIVLISFLPVSVTQWITLNQTVQFFSLLIAFQFFQLRQSSSSEEEKDLTHHATFAILSFLVLSPVVFYIAFLSLGDFLYSLVVLFIFICECIFIEVQRINVFNKKVITSSILIFSRAFPWVTLIVVFKAFDIIDVDLQFSLLAWAINQFIVLLTLRLYKIKGYYVRHVSINKDLSKLRIYVTMLLQVNLTYMLSRFVFLFDKLFITLYSLSATTYSPSWLMASFYVMVFDSTTNAFYVKDIYTNAKEKRHDLFFEIVRIYFYSSLLIASIFIIATALLLDIFLKYFDLTINYNSVIFNVLIVSWAVYSFSGVFSHYINAVEKFIYNTYCSLFSWVVALFLSIMFMYNINDIYYSFAVLIITYSISCLLCRVYFFKVYYDSIK